MSLNDIITEALTLKPQERYLIIENLVQSLNQPNPEIDKLWIEESMKRVEAMKKGTLKTVSYEDVFSSFYVLRRFDFIERKIKGY